MAIRYEGDCGWAKYEFEKNVRSHGIYRQPLVALSTCEFAYEI